MTSIVDTFSKLSDDKKFQNLIILIACIVPGLTYIYVFHNTLIIDLDGLKLLLLSFAFSMPFLFITVFTILFFILSEKGRMIGLLSILKEKEVNFLALWFTSNVLIFYLVLFVWFITFIISGTNETYFWYYMIGSNAVAILTAHIHHKSKESKGKK